MQPDVAPWLMANVDRAQHDIELFGESRRQPPRLNGSHPAPGTRAGDLLAGARLSVTFRPATNAPS